MDSNQIKEMVKQKYSEIALQNSESSCCESSCCTSDYYKIMYEDYDGITGYNKDADLGLGCGIPTKFAGIKKGDTVVDLGSGAGNDCFVARAETGETGKVIGIDFSDTMIEKARQNTAKKGFDNVTFLKGDIEDMPLENGIADVVISNCVLNLLPKKDLIFREIFRVLKSGGHFCISDVVMRGEYPAKLKGVAELYVGCVSGAIQQEEYLNEITKAGFTDKRIVKENLIVVPDEILKKYLTSEEFVQFKEENVEVVSITVTAKKPIVCCQ